MPDTPPKRRRQRAQPNADQHLLVEAWQSLRTQDRLRQRRDLPDTIREPAPRAIASDQILGRLDT